MAKHAAQRQLFDDLPERDRSPLRARWWIFAIAVHASLLWLPIAWYEAAHRVTEPEPVTVTIERPLPEFEARESIEPVEPAPPEESTEPVLAAPTELVQEQAREAPAQDPEPVRAETPSPEEIGEPEQPTLEVQQLLDTVATMDWSDPAEVIRELGRSTESEITGWLRQPVLALEDNTFDGMAAPSEVEITDRWMSPGGEHNVVIRAPDGSSYCGRQGPADDLRPWLQMPMLFHRCAGGGKRSGGSSWRNN
jgi:hypothetical protein